MWRIFVAIVTLGIVRLEKKNAGALRDRMIDEKIGQVAQAKQGLGELAGAARQQARTVSTLEEEKANLERRKLHFMGVVRSSTEGSKEATSAKAEALKFHRELADVVVNLNAARAELARITQEFEASKQLIVRAEGDVATAKQKGRRLKQRRKSAQRREQLVKTTSSLRGVAGIGDDLADLDEMLEAEIDGLEGAAFVAASLASEADAGRQLDIQLAQQETDDAFEAELLGLEKDVTPVETPAPALREGSPERKLPEFQEPERDPVPASRTSGPSAGAKELDFGSGSSGSSDSGSTDFGGASSDD